MNVSLSQWQTNVWKDQHRYVVVNCGRRAGKTYVTALKMLDFATKNNKVDVWYVAPTYKQAKGILWEMLLNFVPKEVIKRKNETELRITLINDSSIFVKGAEEPDNLRGVKIDLCVFDECAFIDKWETVWTVMRPMLIDSKARVIFISTPNGLQNHFKTLADQYQTDDDFSYHHYTTYDNPFLDKGEIEEARKEMSEDAFAQEHLGEFRRMSGLIFKEFKRETHMVTVPFEQFDSNWTYTRVIDFGFGHKTALIYFAISPNQNEIYAYDGLYVSGFTERQIAEVAKVKDGGRTITNPLADSAQPMAIAELMNYGIIFNPITKGKDSVVAGMGQLAELLKIRQDTGRPTLMFNKTLDWIAVEFERYHWIPNKNDPREIKQIPYKVLDDAMDCIRYFAMGWKAKKKTLSLYNRKKWSIH